MKKLLIAASLFALAAPAMADTLAAMQANTVTTTTNGATTTWKFNADNTFTMTGPDGSAGAGTYRTTADQFCLTITGAQEVCVPAPPADKNPGDSWQGQAADGGVMTVAIVAGR